MLNVMMLCASLAQVTDPFEAAKSKAVELEGLAKVLEAYTGSNCDAATDPLEAQECQTRNKKVVAGLANKDIYLHLGSDLEGKVEVESVSGGRATVVLSPVFDVGAGVALTFAKPVKLDANGTIVVNRLPLDGVLLDDMVMAADLKRMAKTSTLTLELVATIKGTWELKKKDGTVVRGVELRVSAVRLGNKRGGKGVLAWTR